MPATDTYAIIQLAGKQYRVSPGDQLKIDRLDTEADETLTINDVLLVKSGDKVSVGTPLVKGASVTLKILSHQKDKKIRVATYKAKSRYRRVKGHRQAITMVEVAAIKA